ncbi:hypothetical protein RJ639_033236 [Escallonia herrerae]|uniref:Phytocyanin domain-containing protein n=1 Tax=Escallonia herrerae TaxID=1293975 RepID=A0AA89BBY4_9ASTE|nr:hypothetical protein RJ639_033236 [Escallonia herrerae]
MAYNMLGFFIILAVLSPAMVSAKDFVVGDDKGWTTGFDYKTWAKGKDFRVGDRLIFQYPVGAHNVFKVNGTGFESCIKPALTEALTSGNDVIVLATPGRKWYICGVGPHCAVGGQKLFITVTSEWMAPSPSPLASSANGITAKFFPAAMILVLIVLAFSSVDSDNISLS